VIQSVLRERLMRAVANRDDKRSHCIIMKRLCCGRKSKFVLLELFTSLNDSDPAVPEGSSGKGASFVHPVGAFLA